MKDEKSSEPFSICHLTFFIYHLFLYVAIFPEKLL